MGCYLENYDQYSPVSVTAVCHGAIHTELYTHTSNIGLTVIIPAIVEGKIWHYNNYYITGTLYYRDICTYSLPKTQRQNIVTMKLYNSNCYMHVVATCSVAIIIIYHIACSVINYIAT